MAYPLNVAFVWHMHQPFYKDELAGGYTLPWVRLHATKDYLHMAQVLEEHPTIHQTFNFVPSLVEQLDDYAAGRAIDRALGASLLVARGGPLDADTRRYLLDFFYSTNWDRFLRKHPRYEQLLRLRNQAMDDGDLFSQQYYLDLVTLFNLVWVDPTYIARDPDLSALVARGRDFTPADVALVLEKHREICGRIVPTYVALAARGQVELTTSPYYHPILPLLADTRVARVASPWLPLPNTLFSAPQDAADQMSLAVDYHTAKFGQPPRGIWPSEGSVSKAAIEVVVGALPTPADGKLNWIASDEGILARSLGRSFDRDGYGTLYDPRTLYQPYRADALPLAMIFRDQVLSDRIGFVYQSWDARDAARDLVGRLDQMADRVGGDAEHYLVPIILDGENCWENYPNNGQDFLDAVYSLLAADPKLKTVRVSEHLDAHPPRAALETVHPGSWIGSNFETWIGESAQNRAWESLTLARGRLAARQRDPGGISPTALQSAWREIHIAEGSDWFWWYYSRNNGGRVMPFDADFRAHVSNVYSLLKLTPPGWLANPIVGGPREHSRDISGPVTAPLDAGEPIHPGWAGGGFVEAEVSSGSMQRGATLLRRLYYGYASGEIRLRLEANDDLRRHAVALYVAKLADGHGNAGPRFAADAGGQGDLGLSWEVLWLPDAPAPRLSLADGRGGWAAGDELATAARTARAVDVRLPLDRIAVRPGDAIGVIASVALDRVQVDALPSAGLVVFSLPPV